MKFSIILPIYKVEKYLRPCVDSVLSQTFQDFEIILVDDGSPDSCPQICDEYAANDARVRVIHQQNGGLAAARNAGLDIAQGEYICYVDSDDYLIDNNVLQKIADASESHPDIIHYKFVEWFESDGHIADCYFDYKIPTDGRTPAEMYSDLVDKDAYYNSAWSKVIRRQLLQENSIRFHEGIVGEDNEWYYHVVMVAQSLVLIDEPLYVYRRRQGSITTTNNRKHLLDQLFVLDKWEEKLKGLSDDNRTQVIWGSLAKQYCSALIIYAGMDNVKDLLPRILQKKYLLKYSRNKRVVIFRWLQCFFGVRGLICLLKLVKKLKK